MRHMTKKLLFILVLFCLLLPKNIFAQEVRNNKFGIHIIDESDLSLANELVNGNGGAWGYATVVIREDERVVDRWQKVFDQMRRLRLIPIVRLATKSEGSHWRRPVEEDAVIWSEFLDKLNWPVRERLVVLFNEPNHAKEWGGKVDPVSYAKVIKSFESQLRRTNQDFKILPGAVDLAANNSKETMTASRFFEIAHEEDNFHFTRFDYWNSHSYPNPAFSATPNETGQQSISGYKWELSYLEDYGLRPDIKVLITETGWIRSNSLTEEKISEYYEYAFNNVWNDPQVIAVTPFVLSYDQDVFEKFSWVNRKENTFYKYFETVKNIPKTRGNPEQFHNFEIVGYSLANQLVAQSEYTFKLILKNTGQSIWSSSDGYSVHYDSTLDAKQIKVSEIPETEPGQTAEIYINLNTLEVGKHKITLSFNKDGSEIGEKITKEFEILTPPSLEVRVLGWFGVDTTSNEYHLSLFDEERTILDIENLEVVKGIANVPSLYNVVPGKDYRIKIERNLHLAKTTIINIDPFKSKVDFGRLLPSVDLEKLIANPLEAQRLISPF